VARSAGRGKELGTTIEVWSSSKAGEEAKVWSFFGRIVGTRTDVDMIMLEKWNGIKMFKGLLQLSFPGRFT
jgi:hypothetical protein